MTRHLLLTSAVLLASLAASAADSKSTPAFDPAAGFRQLKTLVGEWQADTPMGKARVTYELIAGGTALVERESMGDMPPMLTVYYLDAGRLMLTHYCMVGNQPRMQARAYDPATGELQFRFVDAGNLTDPAAGHMHNADIRMVDEKHLIAAWQFYENGQLKNTETAQYTRTK